MDVKHHSNYHWLRLAELFEAGQMTPQLKARIGITCIKTDIVMKRFGYSEEALEDAFVEMIEAGTMEVCYDKNSDEISVRIK